ncbi:MAG: secretin N-terminal domain-containing protein [Aliidongia sp.]
MRATEVFLKFRSAALTGTALAVILTGLSGCGLESDGADPSNALPKKTPNELAAEPKSAIISNSVERRKEPTIEVGPAPPQGQSGEIPASKTLPVLTGQVADISIEQMPIPAFINTVLGETLHLTFEIDPKVSAKTDVVTLRTGGPKSAEELLMITREVLRTYGISLSSERNLVRVRLSESLTSEMPQIIIGRTAADLAENLRPVFQVLVLDHVNNQDMASWLQSAFGSKIKFIPSPANNSIILLGLPDDVKSASEGIRLLDQPRLAGRQSLKITPVFWTAATLAEKLGDVLRAEGYNVSSAPVPPAAVTLLPAADRQYGAGLRRGHEDPRTCRQMGQGPRPAGAGRPTPERVLLSRPQHDGRQPGQSFERGDQRRRVVLANLVRTAAAGPAGAGEQPAATGAAWCKAERQYAVHSRHGAQCPDLPGQCRGLCPSVAADPKPGSGAA